MGDEEMAVTVDGGEEQSDLERFLSYLKEESEEDEPPEEETESEEGEDTGEEEEREEKEEEEEAEAKKPELKKPELDVDDFDRPVTLPDGNKVTVKELVQGYFRQKDYTKKTQALAEERRQVEKFMADFQSRYANLIQFEEALRQRPYIAQAFGLLFQGDVEGAAEIIEQGNRMVGNPLFMPPTPAPAPMSQAPLRDPRVDALIEAQRKKELERLDAEWARIRERRPDLDPDQLLNQLLDYAASKGNLEPENVSLEEAYRELYWDYELRKAKQEGQKKATRQMKKGAASPTSMRQSKTAPAPSSQRAGMSDVEKAAARYAELLREE